MMMMLFAAASSRQPANNTAQGMVGTTRMLMMTTMRSFAGSSRRRKAILPILLRNCSGSGSTTPRAARTMITMPNGQKRAATDYYSRRGLASVRPTFERQHRRAARDTNVVPDFSDAAASHGEDAKTVSELLRGAVAFGLCRVPFVARHAEPLLRLSRAAPLPGPTLTDWALQKSLFGHFCAGRDQNEIRPAIEKLQRTAGVGAILDYAAEAAAATDDDDESTPKNSSNQASSSSLLEERMKVFLDSISHARGLDQDRPFCAVKVTALVADTALLERVSSTLRRVQSIMEEMAADGSDTIARHDLEWVLRKILSSSEEGEDASSRHVLERLMRNMGNQPLQQSGANKKQLAGDDDSQVDYSLWLKLIEPQDLAALVVAVTNSPAYETERDLTALYQRGHALGRAAAAAATDTTGCGGGGVVRLLMDAEQVRYQAAIDHFVFHVQKSYNTPDCAVVYNTYQCYLTDSLARLQRDAQMAQELNVGFGAKLVRGAYMEQERAEAAAAGRPSPVHDTIQGTHDSYNAAVEFLLEQQQQQQQRATNNVNKSPKIEIMLATHNQDSIERAIEVTNKLGLRLARGDAETTDIAAAAPMVTFAQLYGMMDHITIQLGKHGYSAYKYLPYGSVETVMPYLIRRANENGSMMATSSKDDGRGGGAQQELSMIYGEIKRRLLARALPR